MLLLTLVAGRYVTVSRYRSHSEHELEESLSVEESLDDLVQIWSSARDSTQRVLAAFAASSRFYIRPRCTTASLRHDQKECIRSCFCVLLGLFGVRMDPVPSRRLCNHDTLHDAE